MYGNFVGRLKGGVKDLYIAEELTKFAKSFAKLDMTMDNNEKEGVETILAINVDAQLAIDASRVVVTELKNVCDTLLLILNNFADQQGLKDAISTYLSESKLIDPKVDAAIEKLTIVIAKSIEGNITTNTSIPSTYHITDTKSAFQIKKKICTPSC